MGNQKNKRNADLAVIHIAKKQLGMKEGEYQALLCGLTGKASAAALTAPERKLVIGEFKRLGFKNNGGGRHKSANTATGRKIKAMWLELFNMGVVRNSSDYALNAFVKRQTGVDNLDWISNPKLSQRVISALAAMKTRNLKNHGRKP